MFKMRIFEKQSKFESAGESNRLEAIHFGRPRWRRAGTAGYKYNWSTLLVPVKRGEGEESDEHWMHCLDWPEFEMEGGRILTFKLPPLRHTPWYIQHERHRDSSGLFVRGFELMTKGETIYRYFSLSPERSKKKPDVMSSLVLSRTIDLGPADRCGSSRFGSCGPIQYCSLFIWLCSEVVDKGSLTFYLKRRCLR